MTDYPQENLLANALSPYLLQHKDNPVHWREWGDAALGEAKQTGKPILLSIGYAACHWCHVMAHESFENPETAELMNRLFVNIKVDREERPDIDQVYMTALHAMGEQGGWPLTMFLTPDGDPFWGGTYFPPESRYGRPGFRDVLRAIAHLAETDQARIANNTAAIGGHLRQVLAEATAPASASAADLDTIADRLQSSVDLVNGGIGHAPKFPTVTMWEALWRHWLRNGEKRALKACVKWIASLCQGGIYDHLGGGIHRYTVDAEWLVPHFEKMLYDNAQFMRTLVLVHGATGEELFRRRIEETVDCLLRDFRLPDGGFASSFDADSEGEEGRYYVWTQDEVDEALGADAAFFSDAYGVTAAGNWEGKTILNRLGEPLSWDAAKEAHLADLRVKLFEMRNHRIAPGRDDKVLADWNGLAIRGFAEAGQAFGRPDWIDVARETFDFVMQTMRKDSRLAHAYRDGRMTFPALATDLSSMINAAVSLYAARPDESVLDAARALADEMEKWHSDGNGGYYLAAADRADLVLRARSEQDEAIPSATAMAIEALARLALVTNSVELQDRAETAAAAAWGRIHGNPYAAIGIANVIDTVMQPSKLVTIGTDERFAAAIHAHPDPARIDIRVDRPDALARLLGSGMPATPQTKTAAAYLCRGPVCLPPVSDPEALQPLLRPTAPETTS